MICYNCGQKGHTKPKCTEPPLCYGCKGRGHLKKDCPLSNPVESPATRIGTVSDSVDNELARRLISPSPRGTIQIAGIQIGCVYDTGAETSVIPSSIFHTQLKEKLGEDAMKKMDGLFMNVVGIGGLEVPIEGYVEVPVLIDGQTLKGSFLVTEDCVCRTVQSDHPILIGCNILRKLDHGPFEKFPILRVSCSSEPESESVHFRTSEEEVLPPFSIRRVMCEVKSPKLNKELFVTDALGRFNPTLSTIEGSQVLKGNSVELLLQNKSEYEVCLPSNTPVAEAQSACRKQEVHINLKEDNVIVSVYDVITDHKSSVTVHKSNPRNNSLGVEDSVGLPVGVKLEDLTVEEEEKVTELLNEHKDVFSSGSFDLGECVVVPHEIHVVDGPPIRLPYRRLPPSQVDDIKQMLQEMLEQGIIRQSKSPFASPIVVVKKKDGSLRLCIDYRLLNARTVKDSFPLPRIDEALDALGGACFFSALDLAHGYFQVVMHPSSIEKTAFRVPWGLYEFLRMPQGLCNSPSTFQRTMEFVLGDMNLTEVLLYLDDILVFSSTLEEHLERLGKVLTRLRIHGLKVKGKKCAFVKKSVRYLGHIVSDEGIAVDTEKVEKVQSWPNSF